MSEEILRFSIVRDPQAASQEILSDSVVHLIPPDGDDSHPHFRGLVALRQQGVLRDKLVEHAQKVIASEKFVKQLGQLATPIGAFSERIYRLRAPKVAAANALVQEVFDRNAGELAGDPAFAADESSVSDSLLVAAVAPPPRPEVRYQLVRARRAIALIRRLGDRTHGVHDLTVARILRATILLPGSLFPLPDGNDERAETNRKAYEDRAASLARETERATELLDRIGANERAVVELSRALGGHLLAARHQPTDRNELNAAPAVLPRERFDALSESTRRVVETELRLPANAVDVAYAVELLERNNTSLAGELSDRFTDVVLDPDRFNYPGCGDCRPVDVPEPKAANDFAPDTRGKVELAGTQDLLIVRQELIDYRKGEIAHIENVLQGERKARKHRKLHRTEVTILEETEREEEIEEDLQTTDKYELQTETSRLISEDKVKEAGVTVTSSYGPVDVEAHGGFAISTSTAESRSSASSFARDVISRSLHRIRERVLSSRSRTDITEVEIINEHELDNAGGEEHVTGVYRWLDKRYEVQILNYGRRAMLEFMVPEPAAFYKFAKSTARAEQSPAPERPGFCRRGVFDPLEPGDLGPHNYLCFVAKYNASNVTPPPPRYRRVSDVLKYKIDNTNESPVAFAESNDGFKVPQGYLPMAVSYTISGGNAHSATSRGQDHDDNILAVVTIGEKKVFRYYKNEIGKANGKDHWPDLEQVIEWGQELSQREKDFRSYSLGALVGSFAIDPSDHDSDDNPDVIKVSITGHTTLPLSATVHYSVLCERSSAKYQQWQIDTFNAIQEAYLSAKQAHDAEQGGQDVADIINIQGQNPELNRAVEEKELKKFSISILTGQQFESFNAMGADHRLHIPQIDLLDAAAEGSFVRFFEQALEWRHMTYLFYPYFWGNKFRWTESVNRSDDDPLFEQFLQAGYARVWVPVRPGFELTMAHYIQCGGEPWTDKEAPLCEGEEGEPPPMVSLIEEMKEQLGAEFETRPGTVTVRQGETRVVGDGTDFRADDVDREVLIALQRYRIAEVDEAAQQMELREPYRGADEAGIGVAVGAKLIGEPWVVEVPTKLVYLEKATTLISE